jgi:hypothetical protein
MEAEAEEPRPALTEA